MPPVAELKPCPNGAPILARDCGGAWPYWLAWFDGHEELGSGSGKTEEEAVANLREGL